MTNYNSRATIRIFFYELIQIYKYFNPFEESQRHTNFKAELCFETRKKFQAILDHEF